MSRGYLIIAENTADIDYVGCAFSLAKSIRKCMPNASITLITTDPIMDPLFDMVHTLPHGDLAPDSKWKLINDWQAYEASPYDETIKLEADMILPRSIEHWWDVLSQRDLVISTTIRNFKGEISTNRFYRRFIDDNKLPDVYNAITYFKKSDRAEIFFHVVRDVFDNWDQYKAILKCNPQEEATTDWAYAIAAHCLGVENTTLPGFTEMSMVHMKQHINGLLSEDWTDSLVYELLPDVLRVNTYPQRHPFHYHVKSFSEIYARS